MAQANIFMSLGVGSALAICASDGIRKADEPLINKYFVYTAIYLGGLFVPTSMYMLWQYPEWESLAYFDRNVCGLWILYYAVVNFLAGVIGFYRVAYLVQEAEDMLIYKFMTLPLSLGSALLSFHYDRLFYSGTKTQFEAGVSFPMSDIIQCRAFQSGVVVTLVLVIPLWYFMKSWAEENKIKEIRKSIHIEEIHRTFFLSTVGIIILYLIAYYGGFLPSTWAYDRIIAFLISQVNFVILFFTPVYLIKCPPKKKTT